MNTSDRHFLRSFLAVVIGLHLMILAVVLIAWLVGGGHRSPETRSSNQPQSLAERLQPVGIVVTDPAALKPVAAPAHAALSGDEVVAQVCSACHQAGMLGAPKIGDAGAWGGRKQAAGGIDGLVRSALNGKNAMPPRGGRTDLSDDEIKAAVQTMLKRSNSA